MRTPKTKTTPETITVPNAAIPDSEPLKTRKRPSYVALGISIIALAGILGYFTFQHFTTTTPVIAIAKDVSVGATITEGDLTKVEVNVPAGIQVIPQDQVSSVIGKKATINLKQGSLLNPSQISDKPVPSKGTAIVGIKVNPGQMPAQDIKAGDNVTIIATPGENAPATTDTPYTINGVIRAITLSQTDASTVVDVSVPEEQSKVLASIASTGNVAIILTSQEK